MSELSNEEKVARQAAWKANVARIDALAYSTWIVEGCTNIHNPHEAASVRIWRYFATQAEAEAAKASFPKSVKVRTYQFYSSQKFGADITVHLQADGVNKGINEGGLVRLRRFMKNVGSNYSVESRVSNGMPAEMFNALLS